MRRALLLALAGCSQPESPRSDAQPSVAWVYAPAPVPVFGKEPIGRIGRSQAPQLPRVLGIAGDLKVPLRAPTPWAVPPGKDGKARAVIYGVEGAVGAIELVDVDAGRVVWRDKKACAGPVVGVTAEAIVCADVNGVRGVGMDGKQKWNMEAAYLAMSEDRVVVAGPGEAIVVDAGSGDELAHVKLPSTVMVDSVVASCGDVGREIFAVGQDGRLARVAEMKGGPHLTWATPIGKIDEIDACGGVGVLVREAGVDGGSLVAIDRASGKVTGRVAAVHGYWKARDGSERIEIATATGVQSWSRDLIGPPEVTMTLSLGELLASHGELRLVRATPATAVVLDKSGVRAYVPFAQLGAVIGDDAIVGASWSSVAETTVRRIGIPARYRKRLRFHTPRGGVAVPAELRDLPEAVVVDKASVTTEVGKHAVFGAEIDPSEPTMLYTLQLENPDEEANTASVAAIDLAKRATRWSSACAAGEVIGIAVARDVVVCATRTRSAPMTVRAFAKDGSIRWEWKSDHVDRIEAAGDVVLVYDADTAIIVDAATGRAKWRLASDDGGRVRAAIVSNYVVAYERGRVVVRVAQGWPLWSLGVDGVVASISASGSGVLVALEDGDAYHVDVPSGTVHALPGLDLEWRASGDVIAAHTAGGPIPGTPTAPVKPLRVLAPILDKKKAVPKDDMLDPPNLWTPIPPPAPLGDSWQLTLYELAGGLRARNDYGLFPPIAPGERAGAGPIVVASGPGLRVVLVIDPKTGDPQRRVLLGEDVAPGLVFGTVVDGAPIAGAVLQQPLRVVLF